MDFKDYNDIVREWIECVEVNKNTDAELTLKACNDLTDYGAKVNDSLLMGYGYYHMAETYYCLNAGDEFFNNIRMAMSHLEKAEYWELVARCYNLLGITAMNRGNAPIALDYYISGINVCRTYNIPEVEMILNINSGVLNLQSARYYEAENHLKSAMAYLKDHNEITGYHFYGSCIHQNIAACYVMEGKFSKAEECFQIIHDNYWSYVENVDKIVVLASEALYFHKSNQNELRNECIAQIDVGIKENMAVMDIFEDLYNYCLLLLECDMDTEFWRIVDILDPLIRTCNITNMQMKQLSLKIRYYRKYNKNPDFMQAAGLYYQLSERREEETMNMINNVFQLRKRLEVSDQARKAAENENQILATKSETDALTQIPNRLKFNEFSDDAFNRALAKGTSFAIEILDIDYFKEYNDNYGHQAGDECLIAVADCIRQIAEKHNGFCARYGGDEFIIIYEGISPEQGAAYCEELKNLVLEKNIEHKFSKAIPIVTISQGMCCRVPRSSNKVWDFLHTADEKLYEMKKTTRNNYCVS